jgi:hypothetical protein
MEYKPNILTETALSGSHAQAALDAMLAALPGFGLRLVPVQPTADMVTAAMERPNRMEQCMYSTIWHYMLIAAPDPFAETGQ